VTASGPFGLGRPFGLPAALSRTLLLVVTGEIAAIDKDAVEADIRPLVCLQRWLASDVRGIPRA
jgi:hypothetical protein